MGRESAGTVYVQIDADASPLLAKYQQAEAQSRAAGQKIASGLGLGLQQGSQQLTIFNALLAQSQTEEGKAAQAAAQLATALRGVGASASQVTPQIVATAAATESVAVAARHVVPEMAAASGAIRVAFGDQSIRAVERLAVSIFGLGPALQAIFPLVGAIALGEMIFHVAEKFTGLTEEEKKSAEEAKNVADQIRTIGESIQQIDFKILEDDLGRTIALADKAAKATIDAAIGPLIARRALLQRELDEQKNSQTGAEVLEGVPNKGTGKQDKSLLDQVALIDAQLAELSKHSIQYSKDAMRAEGDDNKKGTADAKQALADRIQAFKAFYDDKLSDLKASHQVTLQEELRFRQAELSDAKSRGAGFDPVAREVNRDVGNISQGIDRASSKAVIEAENIQAEIAKKQVKDLHAELMRGLEEGANDAERQMDQYRRVIEEDTARSSRLAQEQLKASGIRTQSTDEIAKLQVEQDYALQIVHTRAQEVQYARDIAAADEQRLSDALATVQAQKDLADQQLDADLSRRLDLEIERAQAALDKQRIEDAIHLNRVIRDGSIATQLELSIIRDARNLSDEFGAALASGIIHHNIGQEIVQSLRNAGQHVLADLFTAGIKEALEATGVNAAAHKLAGVIFGTAATATSAATVGILGKLGQILHIPGLGTHGGTQNAAAASSADIAARSAREKQAAQIDQIKSTEEKSEQDLMTIIGLLRQQVDEIKAEVACACASHGGGATPPVIGFPGLPGGGGATPPIFPTGSTIEPPTRPSPPHVPVFSTTIPPGAPLPGPPKSPTTTSVFAPPVGSPTSPGGGTMTLPPVFSTTVPDPSTGGPGTTSTITAPDTGPRNGVPAGAIPPVLSTIGQPRNPGTTIGPPPVIVFSTTIPGDDQGGDQGEGGDEGSGGYLSGVGGDSGGMGGLVWGPFGPYDPDNPDDPNNPDNPANFGMDQYSQMMSGGPGRAIASPPSSGVSGSPSLLSSSQLSNSNSSAISIGAIHAHGVSNVDDFARRLPAVLKSRAPNFSPATR